MKKLIYILPVLLAFASCQKVIDVDLNDANPNIVIEANYSAEDSTVFVHISLTSSFFNSVASPTIDAAIVTIVDELGNITSVPAIGNGDYQLTAYIPNFGTTYTLNVLNGADSYSAECDMNSPVALEPLTYDLYPPLFGNDGGYAVNLNLYDPAGVVNYYQIILTENGLEYNELMDMFTQDDVFTDGNLLGRPMYGKFFEIGDTIGMELRSIDGAIYDYINQAMSIVGGGNSAAPANPISNWNNGALGYFSAYSSNRQEIIIL